MARCSRCALACSEPACKAVVLDPAGERDALPWHAVYMSVLRAEQVPLYHVCPGGTVARLVTPMAPWRCRYCSWSHLGGPGSLITRRLGESELKRLKMLGVDVLLVDGGEPLALDWVYELPERLRNLLGDYAPEYFAARSSGLVSVERLRRARDAGYTVLVFEHVALVERVPRLDHVYEVLREAYGLFDVLEIHLAYDGSKKAEIMVSDLASRYPEAAIHLIPMGGEEVTDRGYDLVEKLREKGRLYVYLYGEESYTLTDTLCKRCRKPIISRKPWGVRVLAERSDDGSARCKECGEPHPRIKLCKKPPARRAIHREIVVW